MKLLNANPLASVAGFDERPGTVNYFIGRDPKKWRTSVPTYANVKYKNVYPGIDLIYHNNPARTGQLEYDFEVAPHANPSAIALAFENGKSNGENRNLKIDAHGDLVITTDNGEIRFQKPVVYQDQPSAVRRQLSVAKNAKGHTTENGRRTTEVGNPKSKIQNRKFLNGGYTLSAGNQIGFEVGAYDKSRPLIIDPVLTYSTYLGGSGFDYAYGIAVDTSGNAYVTGQTDSVDFPTIGAVQNSGGGNCKDPLGNSFVCFDAFVAKLNPAGSALVYATYLGGRDDDHGTGIAVDSAGNAYVTGYTVSTNFPTINAFQGTLGGGNCGSSLPCIHAFVAKLNPAGSALLYSTYLGGTGNDIASGIAVDATGAAYVVGSTSSRDFPVTSPSIQGAFGGGLYNAFIAKLNPAGSTVAYSTYLGGSGEDHGAAIAADSSGEAVVTGYTISSNFPTQSPLQASLGGGTCGMGPCFDAFISKLNASGSALIYSTYFGGTGGDYGYGIAKDAAGNAYVTGLTTSTNLPVTSGAFLTTGLGTSYDAYIMKLNPAGSALVYSTYLGALSSEAGNAIAVDSLGNAYVTGYVYGQGFPVASPLQASNIFQDDAFVTKLNAAGSALIFSTYLGGSGLDVGQGIAVDASRNVYVTGGTFSTDFPTTPGALKTVYGGGAYNAFVSKISGISLPVCKLSTTSITFPAQGVGSTSQPSTVAMVNNGDSALTLTGITASADFAVNDDCGSSLSPGATCTLSITFTPQDFASRSGTVTITDNGWGSPHIISLVGNGISTPIVLLLPASLNFGQQDVNAAGPFHQITLSNTGNGSLNIASIAASGAFTQANNCPPVVYAGKGCALQITFSPVSYGAFAGQVTVSDDAPGSPHTVMLTGIGVAGGIRLSTASLSFGNVVLGTQSASQAVMLTNSGQSGLTISSIVASGDFNQTNNCVSPMAPGGSCEIDVRFSPSAKGSRKSTVSISDSAPANPHSIILTGVGMAADLSPNLVKFPDQVVGTSSAPQTITLTNAGNTPMNVWQIALLGAQAVDFSKMSTCGATLDAGSSCTVNVTFNPSFAANENASLLVSNDGGGSPQAVLLTGTGVSNLSGNFSMALGNQTSSADPAASTNSSFIMGWWPLSSRTIPAIGHSGRANPCSGLVAPGTCESFNAAFPLTTSGLQSSGFLLWQEKASPDNTGGIRRCARNCLPGPKSGD